MKTATVLCLAAAQLTTAHFGLNYPEWRGDTLAEDTEFDQWEYPCAGVPFGEGNITDVPIDGPLPVSVELGHHWTYIFINLGLGNDTTDFNITLSPMLNSTGEGTLCLSDLTLPEDSGVTEGAIGTVQVITVGDSGSALYNCADVRFVAEADGPEDCTTSEEVTYYGVMDQSTMDHDEHSEGEGGEDESSSEGGGEDAAGILSVNMLALTSVSALSAIFVMGIGY